VKQLRTLEALPVEGKEVKDSERLHGPLQREEAKILHTQALYHSHLSGYGVSRRFFSSFRCLSNFSMRWPYQKRCSSSPYRARTRHSVS
jgi:hypothetical protein